MIKTIKCNGMPLPIICKDCEYGKVADDYSEIECFAPDIDGIPVMGIVKDEPGEYTGKRAGEYTGKRAGECMDENKIFLVAKIYGIICIVGMIALIAVSCQG